jgi:hypothetical protein
MAADVISLAASIKPQPVHGRPSTVSTREAVLVLALQECMRRSFDCPECDEVGFVVVQRPDIVRCLYCGCEWQLVLPAPGASGSTRAQPVAMTKKTGGLRYALVLARYVARFNTVPPSIYTEEAATELMLAALERDTPIQAGEGIPPAKENPDKSR